MKKYIWLGIAAVFVAGIFAAFIHKSKLTKSATEVAKAEKEIRDHLPVGTPRAEAEAYFDSHGIAYTNLAEPTSPTQQPRIEIAMIRGASQSWLIRGDIQISLSFDENGKLTSSMVKEIFTGP